MSRGDPSRRPSNERVRYAGSIGGLVWVECHSCLGDGWHYQRFGAPRFKMKCATCDGLGARQIPSMCITPRHRIVAAPRGWFSAA